MRLLSHVINSLLTSIPCSVFTLKYQISVFLQISLAALAWPVQKTSTDISKYKLMLGLRDKLCLLLNYIYYMANKQPRQRVKIPSVFPQLWLFYLSFTFTEIFSHQTRLY